MTTTPQTPVVPASPSQADPAIISLMHGVVASEGTSGDPETLGDKNAQGEYTAAGIGQWSNENAQGEPQALSAGQVPANFAADAKQYGLDPTDFSLANQNKVLYAVLASDKAAGLTPQQALSKWNSGRANAYLTDPVESTSVGSSSTQNVAAYVDKGMAAAQAYAKKQSGSGYGYVTPPASASAPAPEPQAGAEPAAPAAGEPAGAAPTFAASASDSPLAAGLKTAGNLPSSAYSFGKGVLQSLNPVAIASALGQIPAAFTSAVDANGGDVAKTIEETISAMPKALYDTVVPQFGKDLAAGKFSSAQQDVENNPVGSIAPFVFAGKGAAEGIDAATGADTSGAVDAAMAKVASPVTAVASKVGDLAGKAAGTAGSVARYAFGQATGLEPSTIKTIEANPDVDFSTVNRASLGDVIKTGLDDRETTLGETGAGYDAIKTGKPITVDAGFLGNAIEQATGLKLQDVESEGTGYGKFAADATSKIDAPGDITKIQRLYDAWQPRFDEGTMTPDDFLTLRTKLAGIAYNDLGIKNGDMAGAAENIRSSLNAEFRDQIPGLAEKDSDYSSQLSELKNLRKGILDKNGELTDGAINKIAKAAGKGKDAFLSRLEEISPGITGKIQILKAAEDLESAGGNKVGTYARSAGTVFGGVAGYAAGGPLAAIAGALAEMVLQNPDVATSIIKTYAKSKPLLSAVAQAVRRGGAALNNAPSMTGVPASVFGGQRAALAGGQ